jgi:hypothetical protein
VQAPVIPRATRSKRHPPAVEHDPFTADDLAILDRQLELNIRLLNLEPAISYDDPGTVVDWVMRDLEDWAENAAACPDAARRAWADRIWTRLDEDFDAYQALAARVPLAEERFASGMASASAVMAVLDRLRAAFSQAQTTAEALAAADITWNTYPGDPYQFSAGDLIRLREQVQAALDARAG